MKRRPGIALVLGAGASWASPSGRPLFGRIQSALFDALDVDIPPERRWAMAPEALLSRLAEREIEIDRVIKEMLAGGEPNAIHYAAAAALDAGGAVWTPNFDELVEQAAVAVGAQFHRLDVTDGDRAPCACDLGHLVKVHGTLSGSAVVARSEDVLQPLPAEWSARMREDFRDSEVAIVGYAGADIDLREGLRDALLATSSSIWFDVPAQEPVLSDRFAHAVAGPLRLMLSDRPDLAFLRWAARHQLTRSTPAAVIALTQGPLPDPEIPPVAMPPDDLLRGMVADDFGAPEIARRKYRRAVLRGPGRVRAARAVLTTGLIHGAWWRPMALPGLAAASHLPARPARWAMQQRLLHLTWNGRTHAAWVLAQRSVRRFPADTALRLQAASLAKECDPAVGVSLARRAQDHALAEHDARAAAWATLCLSLALRWTGEIDRAAVEAERLAGGLDALAGPVWRAWGRFEMGAVAALRGDAVEAVRELEAAREVFAAAGAVNFVYDALCAELAARRQAGMALDDVHDAARNMLDTKVRASRFAREVLLLEEAEMCRAMGRLDAAEEKYDAVIGSPTVAQAMLALLGRAEVQRARGEPPVAAWQALEGSRRLGFGYGEAHAAITLGLAGALPEDEAEAIVANGIFPAPIRPRGDGLLRYCTGPAPEQHPLCFP